MISQHINIAIISCDITCESMCGFCEVLKALDASPRLKPVARSVRQGVSCVSVSQLQTFRAVPARLHGIVDRAEQLVDNVPCANQTSPHTGLQICSILKLCPAREVLVPCRNPCLSAWLPAESLWHANASVTHDQGARCRQASYTPKPCQLVQGLLLLVLQALPAERLSVARLSSQQIRARGFSLIIVLRG